MVVEKTSAAILRTLESILYILTYLRCNCLHILELILISDILEVELKFSGVSGLCYIQGNRYMYEILLVVEFVLKHEGAAMLFFLPHFFLIITNPNKNKQPTMAKKVKKKTPPEATVPKKRKSSPSIVTPTKKVKKGKSKTTARSKRVKTALSLLLSSSPLLLLFSLPSSSLSSLSSLLPMSTAPSLSNLSTPKKKKVKDATMPPGLLAKLSHKLKMDNILEVSPLTAEKKLVFDNTTNIKLKHNLIDWFNPVVISSESIKYLRKTCPPSTHESQLVFLMNKFEPGEIKLSFSNAIGKLGNAAHKLFHPLPGCKEKIESRFIELILSIMIC